MFDQFIIFYLLFFSGGMNLLETTQPISNPTPQSEDPFDMLNDDLLSMNLQDAPLPSIIPVQETPSPFGSKTLEPFKVFYC